jgi:hypothetical protein
MRGMVTRWAAVGVVLALAAAVSAGASVPRVIMSEEFGYPS